MVSINNLKLTTPNFVNPNKKETSSRHIDDKSNKTLDELSIKNYSKAAFISFQSSSKINEKATIFEAINNLQDSLKSFNREVNLIHIDPETDEFKIDGNKSLESDLNNIVKAFPEIKKTYYQQDSHNCNVLVHILEVTQSAVKDVENFDSLSIKEKNLLTFMALFHDVEKDSSKNDIIPGYLHPDRSAETAEKALKRFGFKSKDIDIISTNIKMHHWVGRYQKGFYTKEFIAEQFKNFPESYKLSVLLSKADIAAGGKAKYIEDFNRDIHPKVTSEIQELAYKMAEENKGSDL